MAFKDFPENQSGVGLLQRSLERGRLGHAYLFVGDELDGLEAAARTLAKTLNCSAPDRRGNDGVAVDCCDVCSACQRIDSESHPDVHWARPESKTRVVKIEQMREMMREIQLKPTEAQYKVAVIVGADRLNPNSANAFLKTLEEPPQRSVLMLLTTEPQRLLETISSRCLRLNFSSGEARKLDGATMDWLGGFSEMAAEERHSLLGRYTLMDVLVRKLAEIRAQIEEALKARSPLEKHEGADRDLQEKWEEELKAAIEAEYRRRRGELLLALQWWLRDVWLRAAGQGSDLLLFPQLTGSETVARRINGKRALENLEVIEQTQRLLQTNVQETLALEVGLLKLHL